MSMPPKFSQLSYQRPDYSACQETLNALAQRAKSAPNYAALRAVIDEKNDLTTQIDLLASVAFIRCYLDSSDAFYAKEMQENDQASALLDDAPYLEALLNTPFKKELDADLSPMYLAGLEDRLRLTAKGKDLQAKSAQLINQYQQLKATLRIPFRGEELSEGQMTPYLTSTDRETRREACLALYGAYAAHAEEFNSILSQMVKTRIAMAKANGFDRFMDFANLGMGRRSYGQAELLAFCAQVKRDLVPLAEKLSKLQAQRLGLPILTSYDASCYFPDGNPKPVGDGDVLLEAAKGMYDKLGDEIGGLFRTMANNGYIDISASPNKISGMGFCTALHKLKMPYVFGACDGSIHDASTLTHEIGHAYQMWLCMEKLPMPEHCEMPNDVIEIPSKAMEQFTAPFAELFFGADADKFRFHHMQYTVEEICAFCATHEFESWLYENPKASAQERIDRFNQTMLQYTPGVDRSEGLELQEKGTSLFRNMGVYMFPAYVISYALTDMGALELRERAQADFPAAWRDYRALCAAGNTKDYPGLLETAGLHTAYAPGAVARAAQTAARALGVAL